MRSRIALLAAAVAVLATALPSAQAATASRPSMSLAKARQLIVRSAQGAVNASGGGYASVGACARRATWKVECSVVLTYDDETLCGAVFSVANSRVVGGYYHRQYSHRGLTCKSLATPPPPVSVPPVSAPPVVTPTELPLTLGRSVADAYVGGIMRNAYSTVGGVSYCYVLGTAANCSYSFSGNRIADGSFYSCNGNLTVNGTYSSVSGWLTTVDYGIGPQCY